MELFYDLLAMSPFAEAFVDQLVQENSVDLFQSYIYLFRYHPSTFHSFPSTRRVTFLKYVSTCFIRSKGKLMETFRLFDNLLHSLIAFLDSGPHDQVLHRATRSLSSSSLLLLPQLQFQPVQLSINYDNLLHFHLSVLDCDTIDQVKDKILHHLVSSDPVDLFLPSMNLCHCSTHVPQIKHYSIQSTIVCRKRSSWNSFSEPINPTLIHLSSDHELVQDENLILNQLKENKTQFYEKVLRTFYIDLLNGIKHLPMDSFDEYIHLISDLLRHVHVLMLSRSTCPVIQSCLNVIADSLEYVFLHDQSFGKEIEVLFEEERKYFSSFNVNRLKFSAATARDSLLLSSIDTRSMVLADQTAIDCLFRLYQFYELHSEAVSAFLEMKNRFCKRNVLCCRSISTSARIMSACCCLFIIFWCRFDNWSIQIR